MNAMWRGHITFGLISIPVGLYSALESSEQRGFRLLHRKDHAPIKYKKFCSAEDIEVSNEDLVRGYEVEKNRFVVVEAKELEEVQEKVSEKDRTIEILQCVELPSIDPLLFEKPYYVAPEKGGNKAYAVLREALRDAKRVGISRFFLRTKPLLAALIPGRQVMSLAVLRPFEELRDPKDLPIPSQEAKAAEVKLARTLIDQMADEWDPTEHPDEYRRALEKLVAAKNKKKITVKEKEIKRPNNVVDLMEALRKSVGARRRRGNRTQRNRAA
jgi:DNA end-binding protein Ku